jgi:hypothetical protein
MSTEQKTHWKKLVNPDYLGSYSLQPGENLILTISKVTREKVKGQGGKTQECTVIHWVESQKPMILNRLNSKVITKIYNTPYIEDWAGKKIKLRSELVDAFGEVVEALRVVPEEIKLPLLSKESKAWAPAVTHIRGGGNFTDIEKRFSLTEEIKKQIQDESEQ